MNVFKVYRGIRKVGYNCGMPVWFIDCGLGVAYAPQELLRKLATEGLVEKDWVVIRNALDEKGVGTFVDALSYVHCKSEVEAYGRHATPAWFPKVDRWTVFWDGEKRFNFGALRKGQDMLLADSDNLEAMLLELGDSDTFERGCILTQPVVMDLVWPQKVRVYERETTC